MLLTSSSATLLHMKKSKGLQSGELGGQISLGQWSFTTFRLACNQSWVILALCAGAPSEKPSGDGGVRDLPPAGVGQGQLSDWLHQAVGVLAGSVRFSVARWSLYQGAGLVHLCPVMGEGNWIKANLQERREVGMVEVVLWWCGGNCEGMRKIFRGTCEGRIKKLPKTASTGDRLERPRGVDL